MEKHTSFAALRRGAVVVAAAAACLAVAMRINPNLSIFYLQSQDLWLLFAAALLLMIGTERSTFRTTPFAVERGTLFALIAVMAVTAFVGHHFILLGHDLSRDEQMANFDASIFRSGHLFAVLPDVWQDHANALNASFMDPAAHRTGWVSNYLPLNAAFRSLFSLLGSPALTGPFFLALGGFALIGCVRRIWPDNRELPIVALLLYAGSGQILFASMTAYAMPAHLSLNLCWLWLFLRRSRWSDVGALGVAFLAVGLHQPHHHPLVVAPILFFLLIEKDWKRAAFFFFGYCLIGAFWLAWPDWVAMQFIDPLVAGNSGLDYDDDTIAQMRQVDLRWSNMTANLLRFLAWQHLLLLPLALAGFWAARRDRLALALMGGIALTLMIRIVILPYQGHGFGYRYLHGLIGNFILLAIYGWVSLGAKQPQWRSLFLRMTIAGWLVLLPMQAWMAHRFYAPYAQASARIDALDADYAVIGVTDVPYSADLVVNRPFLNNRPLRLLRQELPPQRQRHICAARSKIVLIRPSMLQPIGDLFRQSDRPAIERAIDQMGVSLKAAGCRVTFAG